MIRNCSVWIFWSESERHLSAALDFDGAEGSRAWQFRICVVKLLVGKVEIGHGGEEHAANRLSVHECKLASVAHARACHERTPCERVPLCFAYWRRVDVTALREPLGHELVRVVVLAGVTMHCEEIDGEASAFG